MKRKSCGKVSEEFGNIVNAIRYKAQDESMTAIIVSLFTRLSKRIYKYHAGDICLATTTVIVIGAQPWHA